MRFFESFKKKFLINKVIVIFTILFSFITIGNFVAISYLPGEKIEYISRKITEAAKRNEANSFSMNFKYKINSENKVIESRIRDFDTKNRITGNQSNYSKFVCSNFPNDNNYISFPCLNNQKPLIIMTAWSTFYYDKELDVNSFMSNFAVKGYGTERVENLNFCYITETQAKNLVDNSNGKYLTEKDLVGTEILCNVVQDGIYSEKEFFIRDIILDEYGSAPILNKSFGSFIVGYYYKFADFCKLSDLYNFGKDDVRNNTIVNEICKKYPLSDFNLRFYQKGQQNSETNSNIYNCLSDFQASKDNTLFVMVISSVLMLTFLFVQFIYLNKNCKYRFSAMILESSTFAIFYLLIWILNLLNVDLFIRMFTTFGIYINFNFIILIILSIFITKIAPKKKKFEEKYYVDSDEK